VPFDGVRPKRFKENFDPHHVTRRGKSVGISPG